LVSRGWDATTRFWDPVGQHEVLRIRGASFLQFDPAGRRLAYRGYNARTLGIWELADRSVCRVLNGQRGVGPQNHAGVSFSPDSRILATTAGDGVCLWDPASERSLGWLPTGPTTDVRFDPAGRYLYTTGSTGTKACALTRTEDAERAGWHFGSPRPLSWLQRLPGLYLDLDRKGERLAVVDRFVQALVMGPAGSPSPLLRLRAHPQVSSVALSPDGRYVATGTWRGQQIKVWDGTNGRLVRDLPAEGSAGVTFTPDGARLLVLESEGTYRAYQAGTWQLEWERHDPDTGFTRGLRAALHPDGRLMAHVRDRVNLRLVDLDSGVELAVLPVPESQNIAGYQFSPNGRYVAAVTVRGAVQLWDLLRLRRVLRGLGLDWDPPAVAGSEG
jgi:WD40 repeat protein